jgi:undecaprenyl phosphate N,N'-diacetylbacillosamine 1-phosphate transferase
MSHRYLPFKYAVDRLAAAVVLVPLAPLLGVVALLIRRDSPGPALFTQTRVGVNEQPFKIYKFRTMVQNARDVGPLLTSDNDPRITKLGQFLRHSSIDELPQLLNVLKGEMSFIGPRPEIPEIVKDYTDRQRGVFQVRPGLSGWAQIHGRDELDIPTKLNYDLEYVDKVSLAMDLKILFMTFPLLISRRGVN